MKKISAIFLTLAALMVADLYGDRRRAAAPVIPASLSVEFVDVAAAEGSFTATRGNAWLDVGSISKRDADVHGTHVRRQFAVRIIRSEGVSYGTARVTARLQSWDGRATVRLDGQILTSTPVLVDPSVAIGATIMHRLEIEVPESVAAGPINASIVWQATSD